MKGNNTMSETNQIDTLYPMQYTVTRHEVPIYDKDLSQIGMAPIGTKLISIAHRTSVDGENLQILLGSTEKHIFVFKDADFVNGDASEVVANDIETNVELTDVTYGEFHANARAKDVCTTLYGPGNEYFELFRLQKGQRIVIDGRLAMTSPIRSWVAVYQKSKKSDDLKYLGFVNEEMLDVEVAAEEKPEPIPEPVVEPTMEEKVDQVVQMPEGPKKEELKAEIRGDLLSQPITVMGFKVDTDVKRNNVYNKLGEILEDNCAMIELGDGKTYSSLISAGFKTMPSDYKTTLYVIVPNDLVITLKKKMVGRGLKPMIITRG
jgi:hypothetical protein